MKRLSEEMTAEDKEWLRLWHIARVCPACCHENGEVQGDDDPFEEPCEKDFVTATGKKAGLYWCGGCGSAWSIRIDEVTGEEILHIEPDEQV